MKTELRLAEHRASAGAKVVEIWHDGQFIGSIYGSDGPGIRIMSKHPIEIATVSTYPVHFVNARIDPTTLVCRTTS